MKKTSLVMLAALFSLTLTLPQHVRAEEMMIERPEELMKYRREATSPAKERWQEERETQKEERQSERTALCQEKESRMTVHVQKMVALSTQAMNKFDGIVTRIDTFYTTKVAVTGQTIPNYDALKATIAAKKGVVQKALEQVEADAASLDCSVERTGQPLMTFRSDVKAVTAALQEYRQAIAAFISAIKPKAAAAFLAKPSASPSNTQEGQE